jgi:hypothetical protein
LVYSLKELKGIDPKTQAVKIAHAVGNRNRAKILTEARKKKITVLNVKEIKEVAKKEEEEEPEKEEEVEEAVEKEKPKRKKTKGEQNSDGGS